MKTLQPTVSSYTVVERAERIYNGVLDIFDYNSSSDVTTPFQLALKQVKELPTRSGNILVPGAGIGTYILALLQEGFSPEQITAVELNPAYSRLGYGIFNRLGVNYVTANFLNWQPRMKFDVIIGNPPYQEVTESGRKDQASNLWTKFWVKSLDLLNDDGYVSLITPTSWMSPSANLKGDYKYKGHSRLWDVFNSYSSTAQVTGIESFFKGVGSSFGIVNVNKGGSQGLSFVEGYTSSLGFLPKSNIEEVTNKIGGSVTLGSVFKVNQNHDSGWRVSVPLTRKVTEESIEILQGDELPTKGSPKPGLYVYVHVFSESEAISVKETVIPCIDILNVHCRWSGFMNIKIFTMINYHE
jgi:hypothetical protein